MGICLFDPFPPISRRDETGTADFIHRQKEFGGLFELGDGRPGVSPTISVTNAFIPANSHPVTLLARLPSVNERRCMCQQPDPVTPGHDHTFGRASSELRRIAREVSLFEKPS
jgi:hypothetical protein